MALSKQKEGNLVKVRSPRNSALEETIGLLLAVEGEYAVFARNLFPRHIFEQKSPPTSFNGSESKFLFLLTDELHNVPLLLGSLASFLSGKADRINSGLVWAVWKGMNELADLANGKRLRKILGIRETKKIALWVRLLEKWQLPAAARKLEKNFKVLCPQLWTEPGSEEASK